ncbi:MAG: hypothetical protein PHI86_04915, partial [Candidatus Omnitrophica bacterium]|nr:hypothetical protein [Candidatus Omnitrophota bacterium]
IKSKLFVNLPHSIYWQAGQTANPYELQGVPTKLLQHKQPVASICSEYAPPVLVMVIVPVPAPLQAGAPKFLIVVQVVSRPVQDASTK